MSDQSAFEHIVATSVESIGVPAASDGAVERTISRVSNKRQRPRWLALIKEPPMRYSSSLAVGSPAVRVVAIMVATLLLALMVAGAGIAGSRLLAADGSIVVDQSGSGDFTTITEAVAAAVDGDEILVLPGTYEGSIVIDKDITLLGEVRDSVIIEHSTGCTFDEEEDEQTCPEGTAMLRIESPSGFFGWDAPFGIHLVETAAEVGNLTIHDNLDGIGIVASGGSPVIHDVTLTQREEGGVMIIQDGSSANVTDSDLGDLQAWNLSPVTLTGNGIREVSVNTSNADPTGGESTVSDNQLGVLSIGGPVTVEGNVFPKSMAFEGGVIGIFVERGGGWVIRDNVINGRPYGMQALSDGLIEGNVIEGNDIGFQYTGDPPPMSGNRICDNKIANVRGFQTDVAPDAAANEICADE